MIYIGLLRGINVGGHNKLKMSDLRRVLSSIGLDQVQTYIQSGNILFASGEAETLLSRRIAQSIERSFGLSTAVILRPAGEFEHVIRDCPFTGQRLVQVQASPAGESLYVAFLSQAPSAALIEQLESFRSDGDDYQIGGRHVYLLFPKGIRNSKLASQLQKLDQPTTVRNWKTVTKLSLLAQAMLS